MPADSGVVLTPEFQVCGEQLSADQAEELKQAGWELIGQHLGQEIVVDLSQLQRANSVLVAVLLSWNRRAYQLEKSLRLAHPSQALTAMLSFSGLQTLFNEQSQ